MILLLSSLAPTVAYAPGLTLSLANACRTPPGVVPTSINPISSPRKLWFLCKTANASRPLGSRVEVRQTPNPVDEASLATTKGLVLNRRSKSISGRWHKARRRSSSTSLGTVMAFPREKLRMEPLPIMDKKTADFLSELEATDPTSSKNFCCLPPLARVPGEPCSEPNQAADDRARRRDHPCVAINSTPKGFQLQFIDDCFFLFEMGHPSGAKLRALPPLPNSTFRDC